MMRITQRIHVTTDDKEAKTRWLVTTFYFLGMAVFKSQKQLQGGADIIYALVK